MERQSGLDSDSSVDIAGGIGVLFAVEQTCHSLRPEDGQTGGGSGGLEC